MDNSIVESILKERYYRDGETSWHDIAWRVANYVGDTANEKSQFFDIINERKFIPNSPALMNAGGKNPMLFACYALGADDSIEGIFDTMKVAAQIMRLGGGVGVDWSHLRPEGALVKSTNGTSSGVIAFMRNFNEVIETVKSGGRRRGAGISLLDVNHGDIEKFITCKNEEGIFPNFNISVKLTNEFMHNIDSPQNANILDLMATAMWQRSEPGVCFIDTAKNALVVPLESDEDIGLNPCGEQVLVYNRKKVAGECCNLGSMNMVAFYDPELNDLKWDDLKFTIQCAVRYLDNSIDKSIYPTENIEYMAKQTRKIGLGEMGWADLFLLMDIRYGSERSLDFIDKTKAFIKAEAERESVKIADEKGAFPKCGKSCLLAPRRNAALTTEAPTGSLSLFADVSSGIEPVFSYVVDRKNSCGTGEKIVHKLFDAKLHEIHPRGSIHYNEVVDYCHKHGSVTGCDLVSNEFKNIFVTAIDVTPTEHINVQAAFQRYTDASISKTLNLPESTTTDNIKSIIKYAWTMGLKGLTIYRQNSRKDVVYDLKKDSTIGKLVKIVEINNPVKYKLVTGNGRILPKTPRTMNATVNKRRTACGKLYVIPAEAFDDLHSMFLINKGGGCDAMTQALAELIGSMLRWGVPRWEITRICSSIICPACRNKRKEVDGNSCADIIAKVILDLYPEIDVPPKKENYNSKECVSITQSNIVCPECGEGLIFESGCVTCKSCGYSRCG